MTADPTYKTNKQTKKKKPRNGCTAIFFLKLNNVSVFLANYLQK
jgi:hypothetical protein